MDKREEALREALNKNFEETERWLSYEKETKSAIENLETFSKRLAVEVMVPVGRKAFIPGHLIHTNEVLVGHYQGYFSKCSAHKANEICEHRIKAAQGHLKLLATEAELWQNKLDKPHLEGVLPNEEVREIIEDYDETMEARWREEHKLSLKQAKIREKKEKECTVNGDKDADIFTKLDEAELMEELETELNELEVDATNDETIRQLMSGELKLPTKKKARIAHNANATENAFETNAKLPGVVKKSDLSSNSNKIPPTNNNVRPNPELLLQSFNDNEDYDGNESDASTSSRISLPEEVEMIREQAKFLPSADQIGFYEYQIQIVQQKLLRLPISNQLEIDQKIHLLSVFETLEALLEMAEEAVGAEELAEKDSTIAIENEEVVADETLSSVKQKRRISFARENQTLEFRKNETVAQMMPTPENSIEEKPKRDIITLDEPVICEAKSSPITHAHKKQTILEKVEQNLNYVTEHQSKCDFDLVSKIMDSSMGKSRTLHISFKHSAQPGVAIENALSQSKSEDCIPTSPADFYHVYLKSIESQKEKQPTTVFINSYDGEDQVKIPVLREANRQQAYEDPRIKFSAPGGLITEDKLNSKSILRNKSAVVDEKHLPIEMEENQTKKVNSNKMKNKQSRQPEHTSAFSKVMNDVVEKPITEPEPLPKGNFIDAHVPKKRVSRFKQMRTDMQNT